MKRKLKVFIFSLTLFASGLYASGLIVHDKNPDLKILYWTATYKGQPFSGIVFGHFRSNLRPENFRTYWDGKLSGYLLRWYSNGQMRSSQQFLQGLPQGVKKGWYKDGKAKYQIQYHRGEAIGESWAWHSNGKISNYVRYGKKENSAYKSWTGVGKPYYNYVLGDQGRIGMRGGQFCKRLTKSRNKELNSLSQL